MARRRRLLIGLLAGAVLVAVAVAVVVNRGSDDDGPATSSGSTEPGGTDTGGSGPSTPGTDAGSTTTPAGPIPTVGQTADGYRWQPVRIGGGGNITGIDTAADGTMVVSSDVYGAYIRPAGENAWRQLLTTEAVPDDWHLPKMGKGTYAVAIAPSDPSRIYLVWAGHLFASSDGGTSFVETSFEPVPSDSNAPFGRGFGDKLVVDPRNPDAVLAGGPDVPLRISLDGGGTWSETTVPAGEPQDRLNESTGGEIASVGITGLAFDPNSAEVAGRTSVVYAASWGNGVYRSEDGGESWTPIKGPDAVIHADIDADGRYYALAGDREGPFSVERYDGTSWADITPEGWEPGGIADVENPFLAASPRDAGVVVIGYAGQMFVTRDGGENWSELTWKDGDGDVGWALAEQDDYYLVASDLRFDPSNADEIWLTTGEGTQHATLTDDDAVVWHEASRGLENMVATDVASTRNGPPVFGVFDFGQFSGSTELDDFSLVKGPVDFFSGTTSVAASPFADGYAVSATTDYVQWDVLPVSSGYTDDGGKTWTVFPTLPNGATSAAQFGYGTIAVSEPDNIVWAPGRYYPTETEDFQPYFTTDRGKTWAPVELPGVSSYPADSVGGFMFGRNRQTVVADQVTPGTFYLYMLGEGLFRSTDKGVTWERRHAGDFSDGDPTYTVVLGALPGAEGELFYTDGPAGGSDYLGPQEDGGFPFLHSPDGGATWEPVAGVDKVLTFGFGAPAPGQTVGAIYLAGNVRDEYGIWQSVDGGGTWNKLADYPFLVDWVATIGGDMNAFGTVYIGFGGSSYVYGVPAA